MDFLARVVERLLQAALFVGVVGAVICVVKLQWLAAVGCVALAAVALFAFFHVRYPRCGEAAGADLEGNRNWGRDKDSPTSPTKGDCQGCGRTRDGVLPFQYLYAREPGDGGG